MSSTNGTELTTALADELNQVAEPVVEAPKELTPQDRLALLKKRGDLSIKEQLEKARLTKSLRKQGQRGQMFSKMMTEYQNKVRTENEKLMAKVTRAARQMGTENFKLLEDIYSENTPEQKDEAGNVTQKATKKVNYDGLLAESAHVLAVMKDQRIKSGQRKKTTGSGNARKNHRSLMSFLNKRAAKESA